MADLLDRVVANIDAKQLDFYSPTKDFVIEEPAPEAAPETLEA